MLEWNVIYGNFNSGKIETYNIFQHGGFLKDCIEISKLYRNDKDKFASEVQNSLSYFFAHKCEWEVIVSHWPPSTNESRFKDKKVDVYSQVMMNWDHFINYLWDQRQFIKYIGV